MTVNHFQVLVIGELEGCANRYQRLLQQDTDTAYQVVEALYQVDALLTSPNPHLDGILLDIPLARFDCLAALSQVKSQLGNPCPPIIVIGEADIRIALKAVKAGAADYLVREQLTSETLDLSLRTAIENTELKRELKQQEEQFQVSVENMLDCFGVFSAIRDELDRIIDFRIDYLNDAACANNRMTREQHLGSRLCELLPGHRESGLFDEYCQLVETGEPLIKESLVYDDLFDGERLVRAFDVRANKLNDGFVASWRDITDQKQLELELSDTVSTLQQQQTYLQQLLNTAPIGIGIGLPSGDVRMINDAMLALHGLTREDFERDGMNWCDFTPPEYVDRIKPAMTQLRQQGFLPPEEKEILRPDGSRVPVWISATQDMDNPDGHVAFAIDLTAQKQAEVALKASQQRYEELAEAMPQMVWQADAAGAVNYWNQRWYDYTGLSEAETFDLGGADALHPADRDRTLAQWQRAITEGEVFEIEHRIRRQDGAYRWFINRGIPTRDAQGQITGWIGTITDIEEQKRLEERLQLVLRAVDSLVYDWSLETNEIYRSEQLLTLAGYHPDEVPATPEWWFDQMHPDDQERLQAEAQTLMTGSSDLLESEYRVRHRDGHWVYVWDRSCLVRNEQGELIRVVGSSIDVSHLKQAEFTLIHNQERLNLAMQAAGIGTWDLNLQTQEVQWSDNLQQMFGMIPGSFDGRFETVAGMIHPDDYPQVQQSLQDAIDEHADYRLKFRFIKPDGTIRWALSLGTVFYDTDGVPLTMAGVDMDITERKQAELALQEAYIQLDAALSAGLVYTWRWDLSANLATVNRSFAHLFDLEANTAVIKLPIERFIEVIHPDDQERVTTAIARTIENREDYSVEFRVRDINGQEHWLIARGQVEFDAAGRPIAFPGALADITDLVRAKQALEENEERFQTLANNISQFAWMADETGSIFWYNQRWFDYTGTTLEEMQGWGWQKVHHPDHVDRVMEYISQCFATGETWEDTFPLRGKDGEYRWFLSRAVPVRDAQGQITRWFGTNTDITTLRQTEFALQQTTERLNVALKSSPITLFSQDRQLRYTWLYNPTAPFQVEEVLGKRDEELVSLDSAAYLTQIKQQVLDTGVGLREEIQVTVNDRTRYYDLILDPLWDQNHTVVGITGASVDITERTRLEAERQQALAELATNEARLQGFVESNVVGILYGDIHGGIAECNDEFLRMVGYTRAELQAGQLRWDVLTPPECLPLDEERIAEARERGACTPYEKEYIRKDGSRVPVLLGYSLVGEAREEAVAFILDVSDRKQAETALHESEDRLRLAIESAPMGTWDWNLVTNQLTWDAGCKAIFGLPPEAETSIDLFFEALHPGDRARLEQIVQQTLDPSGSGSYDTEYRTLGIQDGVERWVKATGQAYFDQTGSPLRFVGVVLDITEQKQIEGQRAQLLQQEQAAREAAESANRIKDEFLAILSHELRSPLNPILGWASLLQTKRMSAEVTARALETIERNAKLQTQLIDDLLDVARILRGKLKLEMSAVDPVFVIEAALETVQPAADAKAIAIQVDLQSVGQVHGDAGRLQQIAWNLLTNAVKFTPEGGRVSIQLVQIDRWAQIQVTDTGMGIHPDFLPHIFESFRQEDTSVTRQHGGLGLGLAIVRYLVEAHGGTIAADSPGERQGATFTVKLPLSSPAPTPTASSPRTPNEIDLTGIRVLIVDDSPDTLEILTISLEEYGAEVNAFNRATDVLGALATFRPDILICDIGMPDMDGYTLIKRIRALPTDQAQIPAIALTAYVRDEERRKALSQGFQRHVAKPFDLSQLVVLIAELCL